MLLDTCFLIALQHELKTSKNLGTFDFLKKYASTRFYISSITVIEFVEGFEHAKSAQTILNPYKVIDFNSPIAFEAAKIRKQLRKEGQPIGDFDICIAATALHKGFPLVTRNLKHFERIKNLDLIDYSR